MNCILQTLPFHSSHADKNLENLHQNTKDVLGAAKLKLAKTLFKTSSKVGPGKRGSTRGSQSKMRAESVGNQFRTSLQGLVSTLSTTAPSYIRCIKPNHEKRSDYFVALEVLRQLK